MEDLKDFHCIECGEKAAELYKDYQVGVIKISHCNVCGCVVDKYIEYEPAVIFLDTVLHKIQAYRHLLYNVHIKKAQYWKFALIYLLCDTYLKWGQMFSHSQQQMDEHIFYAALEYQFYMCFIICFIEMCVFMFILLGYIKLRQQGCTTYISTDNIIKSILVSSYGKLLAIPAIIWGQTHSSICIVLTQLFIITSNVAALKAVTVLGRWEALFLLTTATVIHMLLSNQMTSILL